MPSDFHPVFLFLGESPDLAALARLLRRCAEHPAASHGEFTNDFLITRR